MVLEMHLVSELVAERGLDFGFRRDQHTRPLRTFLDVDDLCAQRRRANFLADTLLDHEVTEYVRRMSKNSCDRRDGARL